MAERFPRPGVNAHSTSVAGRVWLHDPSRVVRRLADIVEVDDVDICEPRMARVRSLRYEPLRHSAGRQWQWDDPNGDSTEKRQSLFNGDQRNVRLVELPGGREHPQRRRLTTDAIPTTATASDNAVSWRRHAMLFVVAGELDAGAARAISDRCRRYFGGVDEVTVDLSAATLVDSAGVRLIEILEWVVRESGGRFAVRNSSPIVQRMLDAIGVSFAPSVELPDPWAVQTGGDTTSAIHEQSHIDSVSPVLVTHGW